MPSNGLIVIPTALRMPRADERREDLTIGGFGFGALAVQGVLLAPVGALAFALVTTQSLPVATIVTVALANAYGVTIWVTGRNIAWRDVWWRLPELLEAVSPRQAG